MEIDYFVMFRHLLKRIPLSSLVSITLLGHIAVHLHYLLLGKVIRSFCEWKKWLLPLLYGSMVKKLVITKVHKSLRNIILPNICVRVRIPLLFM